MKKIALIFSIMILAVCVIPLSACGERKDKVTVYNIDCELQDDYTVVGSERVEFYNLTDNAFKDIKFNLYLNAFRKGAKQSPISGENLIKAYPNGQSYGGVTISNVCVKGIPAKFNVCGTDCNILDVSLAEELFPDESVIIEIEYKMDLANVIARTGYNDKTINLANFYPVICGVENGSFFECEYYSVGDPYFSECANYNVNFTCNSDYTVASSGKLTDSKQSGGKTLYNFTIQNARSFCLVLSKEFECIADTSSTVNVNYYYYDDSNPIKAMEYILKALETFKNLFGDYIYDTYSVVQTKFLEGGMEFSGLVMISDELDANSYYEVIVHETAHQWWQTAVGNNEIKYGFLDEGLAEYSTVLFFENRPEFSIKRKQMIKSFEQTYRIFCSVYDKLYKGVNTSMTRSLGEYISGYEYVNIAYIKSCIMFDYLRDSVGDETFFNGIKKYYKENCFKVATPDNLVSAFIKCGANVEGFFNSFFNGKVII